MSTRTFHRHRTEMYFKNETFIQTFFKNIFKVTSFCVEFYPLTNQVEYIKKSFLYAFKIQQNVDFWREKSNYDTEQCLKITKKVSFFQFCILLSHCSKSSFFVQKFNFEFPRKLAIFLGEKLVKMLWFWTCLLLTTLISREKLSKKKIG